MEEQYYQVECDSFGGTYLFYKHFKTIESAKEFAQILANSKREEVRIIKCFKGTTMICQVKPNLEK